MSQARLNDHPSSGVTKASHQYVSERAIFCFHAFDFDVRPEMKFSRTSAGHPLRLVGVISVLMEDALNSKAFNARIRV
jgi:hypothetical protein